MRFKIAPVKLKYEVKDRAAVGRGGYIVNAVGGCVNCHTMPTFEPGGDPFKGEVEKLNIKNYLAGGKCFGQTRSPNITPDGKGLPGRFDTRAVHREHSHRKGSYDGGWQKTGSQ